MSWRKSSSYLLSCSLLEVLVCVHMSATSKDGKGNLDYRFRILVEKANMDLEMVCSGQIRADYGRTKSDVDGGRQDEEVRADLLAELHAKTAECSTHITPKHLYKRMLTELGLGFGPTFQILDNIGTHQSGKGIATLVGRDPLTANQYIIHPTKLDGMLQLGMPILLAMTRAKTMVPTRVSKIWISVSGPTENVQIFSTVQKCTERTVKFNTKAINATNSALCASIDGVELTTVETNAEAATSLEDAPYLCAHMERNVDVDKLSDSEVQDYCELARSSAAEPIEYLKTLDAILSEYGARAMLKVDIEGGYNAPHMKKYTHWLRHQISSRAIPMVSDSELEQLYESVCITARGQLYSRVGQHLAEFLQGKMDPLQIIFSDEAMITDSYRELMQETTGVAPTAQYLGMLVHKRPGLKFLEVGAGRGSSTATVFKTIGNASVGPRYDSYTYTDISPSFFEQAKAKFTEHCRIDYRVFNVEHHPASQGFELGSYDVIIADNVLHATQDLRATLQNIRTLLRRGGKLLLKEMTTPGCLISGFTFGFLPGWWLAKESERQSSPLLTEERWHALL
ncbi:S-adenosyl-L-methionine-dependent methyltransferase [Bimuria novae-zelandiae CBS 107.79]|uniref:S-adenosyl-L-methionine-dependent methyltransferase n=1 Tax=Bimuria novae-zelandiae CBS 107.79 TaxID=1447943 RepID=A0A6A5V1Y4_9PLEO|nr:S-adenosyl-L-methionine-dependent methyltransferase [Bimuria novae-zelandiae CBS 107.79]